MMATVIMQIYYCVGQGDATREDWRRYVEYADRRLHEAYPEADISVLMEADDPDAYLVLETREDNPDEAVKHHAKVRQEVEVFVQRLWEDFCSQTPGRC